MNILKSISALFLFVILTINIGYSQKTHVKINWQGVKAERNVLKEDKQIFILKGENLVNDFENNLSPAYYFSQYLPDGFHQCDLKISNFNIKPISDSLISLLTYKPQTVDTNNIKYSVGNAGGTAIVAASFVPIIKENNNFYLIESFDIDVVAIPVRNPAPVFNYAQNSFLSKGNWYKIKINKTGIHKISYEDMKSMGIDMNTVTPKNIKLYGFGGGMLPESNDAPNFDDMHENPIQVVTANANSFAPGDYFLFYATQPNILYYDKKSNSYVHKMHIYETNSYYFINCEGTDGLRIVDEPTDDGAPAYTSTTFQDCVYFEKDEHNIGATGKRWFMMPVKSGQMNNFIADFEIPNIDKSVYVKLNYCAVAETSKSSKMSIKGNNNLIATMQFSKPENDNDLASEASGSRTFLLDTDKLHLTYDFTGVTGDLGYLDWVELISTRKNIFTGGQMELFDPNSLTDAAVPVYVTEFKISNVNQNTKVWEITEPTFSKNIPLNLSNNNGSFKLNTVNPRRFIIFDGTQYHSAEFVEKVKNQNLHSITAHMLIVTPREFINEANRLAEFHRKKDNFKTAVVPVDLIYNEFSSGMQDITAIRNFIRMLYHTPDKENRLSYVLMFGIGSYDYKNLTKGNVNLVPVFETLTSFTLAGSIQTDDYFAVLDPGEGEDSYGFVDIGIGRFPVKTALDAAIAVDKTLYYADMPYVSLSEWKNNVTLVTDDMDDNAHINQAEDVLYKIITKKAPELNVKKLYLDAFKKENTSSGEKCPELNTEIVKAISEGSMLVNYTGHGGKLGWANESIFNINEINSLTNLKKLPVFVTATCEFSKFDDPSVTYAGVHLFNNRNGGTAGLFTTVRITYIGGNDNLTRRFYDSLFTNSGKDFPRFGDLLAHAKSTNAGSYSDKSFTLFGDPALQFAIPRYNIHTTSINNIDVEHFSDTIKAMQKVTLSGIVTDLQGNQLSDFNGKVQINFFDKPKTMHTLDNGVGSKIRTFSVQNSIIFKGESEVANGEFTAEFIVPKDIDYSYGNGKISYYASSKDRRDASGYSNEFIIGGSENDIIDDKGPEIQLFFDDYSFKNGEKTSTNPLLIAKLKDEQGINTTGVGIGHNITATLDNDLSNSVNLNEYYKADLNSYKSGEVRYKFENISVGKHTLMLKAWDILNNSNTATIDFEVTEDFKLEITNITITPNPIDDFFELEFDINLFNENVEINAEMIDMKGVRLNALPSMRLRSEGFRVGPIRWDYKYFDASKLPTGVYGVLIHARFKDFKASNGAKFIKIKSKTIK